MSSSESDFDLRLGRRALLLGAAPTAAGAAVMAQGQTDEAGADAPFSFDAVIGLARERAAEAYEPSEQNPSGVFDDLDYDAYRAIRYREERRLWRDEGRGFEVELFAPGAIFLNRVAIWVVEDGAARAIPFDATAFDFGRDHFDLPEGRAPAEDSEDHSWTGFRLRFPINRSEVMDEVAVFQGASYFRGVGRDQIFGVSARALAIMTGAPEGEEFPVFTDFWLYRPEPNATGFRLNAVLDSPSIAGAYEILVRPGAETTMDVRSVLFPRTDISEVGLGPLTSMYYFGTKERGGVDDYRDAVHDSSGLKMVTGRNERVWRTIANPPELRASTFVDRDPKGFGLVQRDRSFDHFQDAEARYDKRPSAWITPGAAWGGGGVQLFEIPTESEFNDNIVAFWRPEAALSAGDEHRFDYRIYWSALPPDDGPAARVSATRAGPSLTGADTRLMVVDFDFGEDEAAGLAPRVEIAGGDLVEAVLTNLPVAGSKRVFLEFSPPEEGEVEFRLQLVDDESGAPASETWLYRWTAT